MEKIEYSLKFFSLYIDYPKELTLNKYIKISELKNILQEKYKYNENLILTYHGKLLGENNRLCDFMKKENEEYINIILDSLLIPKSGSAYYVKLKLKFDSKDDYYYSIYFPKTETLKKDISYIYNINQNNQMILLNGYNPLRNSDTIPFLSETDYLQLKVINDYDIINIKIKYEGITYIFNVGRNLSYLDLIELMKIDYHFKFDEKLNLKTDVNFYLNEEVILSLKDGNILNGDILDMKITVDEDNDSLSNIPIFVKLYNEKTITVYINEVSTIWHLKKVIYKKINILPVLQKIRHGNKVCNDYETIFTYGIVKESTVRLDLLNKL